MSDVLNNIVNLFPLSVYSDDVPEHPALKEHLLSRVKALPPYQPESRYAWTGDVKGHGFIHMEADFEPWIDAMVPHLHRYLELLRLRTEYLDLFFQRSWPTMATRRQENGRFGIEKQIIHMRALLTADFQGVFETSGHQDTGDRTFVFQDGIRRHGCAVNKARDGVGLLTS